MWRDFWPSLTHLDSGKEQERRDDESYTLSQAYRLIRVRPRRNHGYNNEAGYGYATIQLSGKNNKR